MGLCVVTVVTVTVVTVTVNNISLLEKLGFHADLLIFGDLNSFHDF